MELNASDNPLELFKEWLALARETEPNDPEAMALATAEDNQPSLRMVLLKEVDQKGFYFYTNMESRKGRALRGNPKAALCFHWKSQLRQVRVEGKVERVSDDLADAYFKTRHPLSRLGAWASQQSQPLASRFELEKRVAAYAEKFKDGDIPRPAHWSGYCLVPEKMEFWQQGAARLHDRFLFTREGNGWRMERLNP